ncbi:unnamed protein product, partial [Owenia fusiformis]
LSHNKITKPIIILNNQGKKRQRTKKLKHNSHITYNHFVKQSQRTKDKNLRRKTHNFKMKHSQFRCLQILPYMVILFTVATAGRNKTEKRTNVLSQCTTQLEKAREELEKCKSMDNVATTTSRNKTKKKPETEDKGDKGNAKCPPGFKFVKELNTCYSFITREKMSWINAVSFCTAVSSNLVAIETEEELNFIQNRLMKNNNGIVQPDTESYWVGGTEIAGDNGMWQWVASHSGPSRMMTFAPWNEEGGLMGDDQHCQVIWSTRNYTMGNYRCESKFNFICEMKHEKV